MNMKTRLSKLEGDLSGEAMRARFGGCDLSFLNSDERSQLAGIYRSVKPGSNPDLTAVSWDELQLLKRVNDNFVEQGAST